MNLRAIGISATCVALNLSLGKLAATLALPVYLDSVGTIVGAALLPLPFALAVGATTSLVGGLVIHPAFPFYVGTQLVIAGLGVLVSRHGFLQTWWKAVLAGVVIGMCASVVSAPVTVVVFGGVTLSGTTAINAVLLASGKSLWQSVIGGSLVVEMLDKPAATLIAHFTVSRMPARLRRQQDER